MVSLIVKNIYEVVVVGTKLNNLSSPCACRLETETFKMQVLNSVQLEGQLRVVRDYVDDEFSRQVLFIL